MKTYPLLPYSKIVYESLKQDRLAHVRTWRIRWEKGQIDTSRLRAAIEQALSCHGVFQMEVDEQGRQYRVTRENSLVGPFHEFKIEKNGEEDVLTIRLNRILGDEQSKIVLTEDMIRAYNGEQLEPDGYWDWLEDYEERRQTPRYARDKQRLEQLFGTVAYPLSPQADKVGDETQEDGLIGYDLSEFEERIKDFEERFLLSLNGLMVLSTEMAIMDIEGADKAGLTWAYNGRETTQEQRIYGSLHRDVPICLERGELSDMIRQTRNRLREGIRLSDYPYTLSAPANSPWHKAVNVIIEPDSIPTVSRIPDNAQVEERPEIGHVHLDIEVYEHPLRMQLRYNPTCYSEQRIRQFAERITTNLKSLLNSETLN